MPRLILLPGLGADQRLFAGLGDICMPIVRPRLPTPVAAEPLLAYALRVAKQLDLRPEDWIGGSSFGSLVAADIARRRPLAGLVLIGGALSSDTLAVKATWLGQVLRFLPLRALHPLLSRPAGLSLMFGSLLKKDSHALSAMLAETPDALLREGSRMLTGYFPKIPVLCPVHAIHGSDDRLMHPPPLADCRHVPGAGHALALTHAAEVTRFLRERLCR